MLPLFALNAFRFQARQAQWITQKRSLYYIFRINVRNIRLPLFIHRCAVWKLSKPLAMVIPAAIPAIVPTIIPAIILFFIKSPLSNGYIPLYKPIHREARLTRNQNNLTCRMRDPQKARAVQSAGRLRRPFRQKHSR